MKKYYLLPLVIVAVFSQTNISELKEQVDNICENPEHKHYEKITLSYITPWYVIYKKGITKE